MLVDLIRVTTRDGCKLDGMLERRSPPAQPQLPLDGVCMVHGTGGNFYSSSLFDLFSQKFQELGCPVLRINTRGHDSISTAVTARGGLRLGAAYEAVDDCRHDVAAWLEWMRAHLGPCAALLGHSLGAVKCLYAAAQEPQTAPQYIVAVSPPRLSYSWFCASDQADAFLATYHQAESMARAGQAGSLMEVKLPLPMVIAAGGYLEKYGPDERYNYLNLLAGVPCPTLVMLGSVEADKNMAFQDAPAAVADIARRHAPLAVRVIEGADHFYSGVRQQAWEAVERWLLEQSSRS